MFLKTIFPLVIKNSFFSAFSKLGIKIISFAFMVFVIRWLGDEGYGQYNLIWSYVLIFAMLSDAGLGMYAIREIAKNQANSQYITSNIIVMRIILASLTIALIMFTVSLLQYSASFQMLVLFASTILLLYAIQDPLDTVLQASERFDLAATAIIIGQLLFVLFGMLFLLLGWHIHGLILANLLNVLASAVLAWWLMGRHRENLQWKIRPAWWPEFIRQSLPFGLIKLWLAWSLKIDLIILSWYWTEAKVGWYSAAYAIVSGVVVISSSVNAALYPALSRQHAADKTALPRLYEFIFKCLLLISVTISGFIYLFADQIIQLLFGAEFVVSTIALVILIWVVPLMFASEFLRYVLLITGQERAAVRALGLAVLLNISLNLWLIPTYGFISASIVAVTSELVLILLYLRQLKEEVNLQKITNISLKFVLITMTTLIMVQPLPIFWQLIVAMLLYFSLLTLTQIIQPRELQQLLKWFKTTRQDNTESPPPPLVTVFIPTYNAAHFLPQAIDSVLQQSYQNFELIILDDGSTDETAAVLEQYAEHAQIIIHRNPQNLGMAANWNAGLAMARGDLIAKLDVDDFYELHYLQNVVDTFQRDEEVGLVFGGLNLLYPDGRSEAEVLFLHSWVRGREIFLPTLLRLCIVRSPTVCVRRACYTELGNFREEFQIHADWEMWVRIASNYRIGYISEVLANYRMNYGPNCTSQAALDGRSMDDLRHWLTLIETEQLPYQLTPAEVEQFRWGIYELEMHFAAMARYYHQAEPMAQAYIQFAEQIITAQMSSPQIEPLSEVMLHLHQGICAFRERQLPEARQFFLTAIRSGPQYCRSPWIWSKLLLTFLGRTKWGIMYR